VKHQDLADQIEALRGWLTITLDGLVADVAGIRSDATIAGEALVRAMAESEIRQAERHVEIMAALGRIERLT
jgi:hypothetical protein